VRDDEGGVWIVTGLVLGGLVYAWLVIMLIAGWSAALPFVVVPPVVATLIGANSLLGGGRYGRGERPAGRGSEPGR
jgi:Mg/Co/Ni transporter MgtE